MPQVTLTSLKTVLLCLLAYTLAASCADSQFASGSGKTASNSKNSKDDKNNQGKDDDAFDPDDDDDDDSDNDDDSDDDIDSDDDDADSDSNDLLVTEESLKCDKGKPGLVGKVYRLPVNTPSLPNFKTLTPVGQVESLQLNVPVRDWTSGFPGISDLVEWFAIEFFATLDVPEDGTYRFRLHSDDGSKLYINDKVVVDNDGTHAPTSKSASTTLKKGKQKLKIEWFQGPRKQIALQVFWTKPSSAEEIIPATVLTRNKDCKLIDLGSFE